MWEKLRLGNSQLSRSFLRLTQAIYYDPCVKFPTPNARKMNVHLSRSSEWEIPAAG